MALASMSVIVAVPTYNNRVHGYTLKRTLEALRGQSYTDFDTLIVYKPAPGDDSLEAVKDYVAELGAKIVVQENGFIEEAMNIIFERSKSYDIALVTDDDAIPSPNWVRDHVVLHEREKWIGVATGATNTRLAITHMKTLRRIIGFYSPNPVLRIKKGLEYACYVNDMGILVAAKPPGKNPTPSFCIAGVNMSYKPGFLNGFQLPGASIRGTYYESLLAYHYFSQGLLPVEFGLGQVKHLNRESLSRAQSPAAKIMWGIESQLHPYVFHLAGMPIKTSKLKRYALLVKAYARLKRTNLSCAYYVGLELAIEGIENGLKPTVMRKRIIELQEHLRSILRSSATRNACKALMQALHK